jgi:hypothetical protein
MADIGLANVKLTLDAVMKSAIIEAARSEELKEVLRRYLNATRDMEIVSQGDSFLLIGKVHAGFNERVHISASYTACVEFALNSPVVNDD